MRPRGVKLAGSEAGGQAFQATGTAMFFAPGFADNQFSFIPTPFDKRC